MSYLQTLSDTESEPDQTKEVVEPLEKSKPIKPKRKYTKKPKAEPKPEPEAEPEPEPEPEPEAKSVKPKRKYTKKAKVPEPEPKTEAVKRVPNEKQKQALEKAREIRRAAKQLVQLKKNKESVEPIVFV